jgi:aryl-alcohol dehydrogenase-like predicted oxidoreductase
MQRKRLGNSDLDITTLGFGAWAIGGSGSARVAQGEKPKARPTLSAMR